MLCRVGLFRKLYVVLAVTWTKQRKYVGASLTQPIASHGHVGKTTGITVHGGTIAVYI